MDRPPIFSCISPFGSGTRSVSVLGSHIAVDALTEFVERMSVFYRAKNAEKKNVSVGRPNYKRVSVTLYVTETFSMKTNTNL